MFILIFKNLTRVDCSHTTGRSARVISFPPMILSVSIIDVLVENLDPPHYPSDLHRWEARPVPYLADIHERYSNDISSSTRLEFRRWRDWFSYIVDSNTLRRLIRQLRDSINQGGTLENAINMHASDIRKIVALILLFNEKWSVNEGYYVSAFFSQILVTFEGYLGLDEQRNPAYVSMTLMQKLVEVVHPLLFFSDDYVSSYTLGDDLLLTHFHQLSIE